MKIEIYLTLSSALAHIPFFRGSINILQTRSARQVVLLLLNGTTTFSTAYTEIRLFYKCANNRPAYLDIIVAIITNC